MQILIPCQKSGINILKFLAWLINYDPHSVNIKFKNNNIGCSLKILKILFQLAIVNLHLSTIMTYKLIIYLSALQIIARHKKLYAIT